MLERSVNRMTMATFRPKAAQQLAEWITEASCGLLIGLPSTGKRRLLTTLSREPQALQSYLSNKVRCVIPLAIDLAPLASADDFWRILLRTLNETNDSICTDLRRVIQTVFEANVHNHDSFGLQTAVRGLIERLCQPDVRIVVIVDRFGRFCRQGSDTVADALYDLHIAFPHNVCLLAGVQREVAYPAGKMRLGSLFTGQQFWLGGMASNNAATNLLHHQLTHLDPCPKLLEQLAQLSGGFPALLNAFADWRRSVQWDWVADDWQTNLYDYQPVQNELQRLWEALTQTERSILSDLELLKPNRYAKFERQYRSYLCGFGRKGVCVYKNSRWHIFSDLFARFIRDSRHTVRGNIWFNVRDDTYYQGNQPLDGLSPRAEAALAYFLAHPYKKCEKDQLIEHIWETPYVTDDSVYQVIRELRRVLEPDARNPCYIFNHRSLRGGRYQFFPEGRPKDRMLI